MFKKLGTVPDFFRVIALGPAALGGFPALKDALSTRSTTPSAPRRRREAAAPGGLLTGGAGS
jgi:hypothetical protein